MMAGKGFKNMLRATMLVILGMGLAATAGAVQVVECANGIVANIYSPEDIQLNPGLLDFDLDYQDQRWFPFDSGQIAQALRDMNGFRTDVQVDVFILPAPPSGAGECFARENAIYLAPGFGLVEPSTVAYITTHEMGHVLTWASLDRSPERWDAYLDLRGLAAPEFFATAAHADRPREILAEDIRFLFGGRLATVSGTIENAKVALPDAITGLQEMLSEFIGSPISGPVMARTTAFPNPCNPMTTIAMCLSGKTVVNPADTVLRVFNIRGGLVRTLTGANVDGDRLSIRWNGTNESGQVVSSGRYLYIMQLGNIQAKGSVTLVR